MQKGNLQNRGFSLIEVLIALVVLSVGLLGIAAMVSVSLKSNDSAYMQTQATELAQAMLERMRANRAQAELGSYDVGFSTNPTAISCMGTSCSAASIATADIVDWKNNISNSFPKFSDGTSAQGKISTVAVAQMTQVTISIRWNDQRAGNAVRLDTSAPAAATYTYTMVSGM